ncbi:MAG: cytochrome-c oxidase, cbb3-type subunit I [Planctomycetota bacterium]|jgi:cytochrome c oxidase cbb3-type subunit I/II|nr:cytochrome-c oxidase, cbb3-type subunit I [Planctomycetota bacterium]
MHSMIERFSYDDDIVRKFMFASVGWGIVGLLVGILIALQLADAAWNFGLEWTSFGRLRPLHTNAVIFAFAGNGIFAAVYYSSQRLLKARMFSDRLSRIHFWGWQAIIASAALTLPFGFTQGREYAELEWPIDIAITLVWVVFAINFFGTLARRRERHLYVALWFYIATIVAIAVLHIFNNLWVIAGPLKSYSIYAGVQDAFMQWWYGHNAVAFFLTTPFLGLMYYFLPKAAGRPVFSYKLSILHFWSLVFIYIWAGPHHLHYTALPEWAATLGMLFSVMLWMPSWGGMLNGLLTLRGAWNRVATDPILKFFVVGITFYGMSTFEGPLLSIKAVNSLSHYTDWTIAHVHAGALGWVGFMVYGMVYWLVPRLYQTEVAKPKWVNLHFWMATIGIVLYIVAIYAAGLTQGLMWRSFTEQGTLEYPDFLRTVTELIPMYWIRVVGGLLYFAGAVLGAVNMYLTWKNRPSEYNVPVYEAAPLKPYTPVKAEGGLRAMNWHRAWEAKPLKFTVFTGLAVISASLFEIIPTFVVDSNVPKIASVKPYTPLELEGRDIYIEEGCVNCHSQMVRPLHFETERFGEYSKAGEFVYDHPFQWGSRRLGPDLHRLGNRPLTASWHLRHMANPQETSPGSIMPAYAHMLENNIDFDSIQRKVAAHRTLGTPYSDEEVENARQLAVDQAEAIAAQIVSEDASLSGYETKDIVALIAYMQRLGTDLTAGGK